MYPERIVCLAAEMPEILHALGVLDRVVGISAYTTRPKEALLLPQVSGFQHGSVKRILDVGPDLAIATSTVQKELAAKLIEAGVTVLHVNPQRLEDMFTTIKLLGNVVGEAKKADQYCSQLKQEIAEIRQQAATNPRRPKVYFEEWMDPMIAGVGWVSDLIEIAGGQDVFRESTLKNRRASDRVVVAQQVIDEDPDIIFASWCGKPVVVRDIMSRDGFSEIRAVKTGAVFEVSSDVLQCGPMLIDALRSMQGIIRNLS